MNETTESADIQLAPGIVKNAARRGGRPTIAGTRITVDDILARLGSGWTIDDILQAYPHLTREHVLQAISYAAGMLARGPWPQLLESDESSDWETEAGQWTSEPMP